MDGSLEGLVGRVVDCVDELAGARVARVDDLLPQSAASVGLQLLVNCRVVAVHLGVADGVSPVVDEGEAARLLDFCHRRMVAMVAIQGGSCTFSTVSCVLGGSAYSCWCH